MPPSPSRELPGSASDAGFSLVELIIAVFLLAVISLALLPLLIGATTASTANRSSVAANSFAEAQLAPLRAAFSNDNPASSCAALRAHARTGINDPASTGLRADVVIGDCPASSALPATVDVTVSVYAADRPGRVLVTLPTRILVSAP